MSHQVLKNDKNQVFWSDKKLSNLNIGRFALSIPSHHYLFIISVCIRYKSVFQRIAVPLEASSNFQRQ